MPSYPLAEYSDSYQLLVLIPAYNEATTIELVISAIPKSIPGISRIQILVVDDGSEDRTGDIAQEMGCRVLRLKSHLGLGGAFRAGMRRAIELGADVVATLDADSQFPVHQLADLVKPILAGSADVVSCTRFGVSPMIGSMPRANRFGNRLFCFILNRIIGFNPPLTDVSCGFRAYNREALLRLNVFGDITYTHESLIQLAACGLRITEIPLPVKAKRDDGKSRVANRLFIYGFRALGVLLQAARDTKPLFFFGIPALLSTVLGVSSGGFVFVHWLRTGFTTPYKSMLVLSSLMMIVGFILLMAALLADMVGRVRRTQDELLYLNRRRDFKTDQ